MSTTTRKRYRTTTVLGRPMKRTRRTYHSLGTLPATRGFRPMYGVAKGPKAEKKVIDTTTAVSVDTTGAITLLNGTQLGNDYSNRIGRKITIKSIYYRGTVCITATNSAPPVDGDSSFQHWRMIIFYDKQPNGATPAVTDVLVTATPTSHLNLNNRDRFKVLIDKSFVVDPYKMVDAANESTWNRTAVNIKKYKKCHITTIYNAGNAGTIADISTNAIFLLWVGNRAATATDDGLAAFSCRLRFWDN